MNVDSGAAISTFPKDYGPTQEGNGRVYKTASGECIADHGPNMFYGYDESGRFRSISGRLADVHKVLCSAGAMTTRGRQDIYLAEYGGWIIPRDSSIGWHLRSHLDKLIRRHGTRELIPLYLENNVYNFYLRREKTKGGSASAGGAVATVLESGNGLGRVPPLHP